MRTVLAVRHLAVGILVSAALVACRPNEPTSTISDSTFVAVMAELKRVHEAVGIDSAQREARRAEILEKRGLTPARLDTAAQELARNPTRAQTVWQAIERRAADAAAASATSKAADSATAK